MLVLNSRWLRVLSVISPRISVSPHVAVNIHGLAHPLIQISVIRFILKIASSLYYVYMCLVSHVQVSILPTPPALCCLILLTHHNSSR